MRPIQTFQVGIKAFVWHEQQLLLVQERNGARLWELPGGRIDVGEELLPPAQILQRELREELGPHFTCTIGAACGCWVRTPASHRPHPVFLVGLLCSAPRGAIVLSDEHVAFRWCSLDEARALPLAPGYGAALATFHPPA
jgi:8-oxo-dGTP diphosphatase